MSVDGAPMEHSLVRRFTAWSSSRRVLVTLFCWSVAEGCVWPIVPDPLLGLMGAATPRRAPLLYATTLAGGVLGALLLWPVAIVAPALLRDVLIALPVVDPTMLGVAQEQVAGHGLLSIAQFGGGTPLKAWSWAWVTTGGGIAPFLLAAVVNRLTRILPFFALTTISAHLGGVWARRRGRALAVGYLVFWLLFYANYWSGGG